MLLMIATAALVIVPAAFGDDSTLGVVVGPEATSATVDATM